MRISARFALVAALVAPVLNAFEFTAPDPETPLNLNASSIKITWVAPDGGPDGYNALDLEWYLTLSDAEGDLVLSSGFIGVNISIPRTTSYDWNPRKAREALQSYLPPGDDSSAVLQISYWLTSPHPNIGRGGSRELFELEGIKFYDQSGAGFVRPGTWGFVAAGIAGVALLV
ncbi:hypothetical protein ACHAQA_008923 [Verticillium albo-atrum]